jgi:hypothetical protein
MLIIHSHQYQTLHISVLLVQVNGKGLLAFLEGDKHGNYLVIYLPWFCY